MERMTIVRHSTPSSLDQAGFGSQCIVKDLYHDEYELYIQTSKNEEHPHWELVGVFNEKSSQFYIDELIDMRLGK